MLSKANTFLKSWYKKDKKLILISLVLGVIFSAIVTYSVTYSKNIQQGIANEVLRFHVLANSDRDYDQELKLKVRDGILEKYKYHLKECKNLDDTKNFFNENMQDVIFSAKEIIKENGYNYDVKAYIGKSNFPTKKYGDISFPAGEYDALKIEIGEAEGQNWWCVMFPPLCFVDVSCKEVSNESKEELKTILSEEEYGIVANSESNKDFQVKFKIIEICEELFN